MCAVTSAGSAPASGRSAASTTVTSQPACRAAVANSAPIQPAPTTTTCCRASSTGRSAAASSSVRSRWTPGQARGPRQRDRIRAGGQHEAVVRQRPGVRDQLAVGGAQRLRAHAQAQVDAEGREVHVEAHVDGCAVGPPSSTAFDSGGRS